LPSCMLHPCMLHPASFQAPVYTHKLNGYLILNNAIMHAASRLIPSTRGAAAASASTCVMSWVSGLGFRV
jgi:hypothetical protein